MNKAIFHRIFWALLTVEYARQLDLAVKAGNPEEARQFDNFMHMSAINSKLAHETPEEVEFLESGYKFMAVLIPAMGIPEATAAFVSAVEQAEKLATNEKRHDANLKRGTILRIISKNPAENPDQFRFFADGEQNQKAMFDCGRLHKIGGFDVTFKPILFFEV